MTIGIEEDAGSLGEVLHRVAHPVRGDVPDAIYSSVIVRFVDLLTDYRRVLTCLQ